MTNTFPFRLVSKSERSRFQCALNEALTLWANEWFSTKPELHFDVQPQAEIPQWQAGKWLVIGEEPELWLAWKLDSGISSKFASMMFNATVSNSKPSILMQALMHECIADFSNRLYAHYRIFDSKKVEFKGKHDLLRVGNGSGILIAELRGVSISQYVVFGGDVVQKIIGTTGGNLEAPQLSLVNRDSTLGGYKTTLEISAGTAEITLQELVEIEAGDIIRLKMSDQEAFAVRTKDSEHAIAKVHLGILDNYKAVQFIE